MQPMARALPLQAHLLFLVAGSCLATDSATGTPHVGAAMAMDVAADQDVPRTRTDDATTVPVVKFGIITDVHYADAEPAGTRIYRDSLPKVQQAVAHISAAKADFLIELGDFKDTDASQHCDKDPSPHCVNITLGFLDRIEEAMFAFTGPKYHILGNHDVDILNQSAVLTHEHNSPAEVGGGGYYSFSWPPATRGVGPATVGCLVKTAPDNDVWIAHQDGTRNWLSAPTAGCRANALAVPDIAVYRKRDPAHYSLNASASGLACALPTNKCARAPAPTGAGFAAPLRFIALNGDYTDHDVAWADLDLPFPGESWSKPNVPTFQMEWLEAQLEAALAAGQRVVVFVHYRLDGGIGGPVGTGEGPPCPPTNRGWVDDCSLENAGVVRALLEKHPSLVLATFSGHDHAPRPPWTRETAGTSPLYFTHAALVEGHFPQSNAFSTVSVLGNCTVVVQGHGNASSATVHTDNCSLAI